MHIFIVLQWFLIIFLLSILGLLLMWMYTGIRARVPYVPVPNSIIDTIEKCLNIDDKSILYDLGAGDGRVLFRLADRNKNARYIGIENGPFPALLARTWAYIRTKRGKKEVTILQKDFFTHDVSDATHIFTYLYPQVMDELLSKFEQELRPGTRLVSATFKFTLKKPIAEIDLGRGKYQLARMLYIYEF